ncbi:MAG: histidine phosphatase family protein [Hirschia sp.]|nr:histidine phosphatase family protein [Hirschia sp.]MBF17883.1 histidine phosphatase family protein [Hirschia sp.]
MSRTVFIVRHGNTFDKGDVVTRVGARTDLPLSTSGQTQAEQLAAHFMLTQPDGFCAAWCSPLMRTRQTAEAILSICENAPSLETAEFLREVDYGPDENQPEEDVIARIGQDALDAWEAEAIAPPGWDVDPAGIVESWKAFFVSIGTLPADDLRPALVVTSNGIARFALKAAQVSPDAEFALKLKTAAYGITQVDAQGAAVIRDWNIRA